MTSKAHRLNLDQPLSSEELQRIVKWYEDEVNDPELAATHDCHVVRALRELLKFRREKCLVAGCPEPPLRGAFCIAHNAGREMKTP